MLTFGHKEKEIIILQTLNGPISLNITKSIWGNVQLSINAPTDVMIYREDVSISEFPVNHHLDAA